MIKRQNQVLVFKEKVTSLEGQLKRAVADYHNLEKRISEGRSELTSFVGAQLISKLLPVLDHLEQALAGISEEEKQNGPALSPELVEGSNGWVKGVELAVKEFRQVLQQEGLDEIVAGSLFDPTLHEAVDTSEGEDNKILEVVRKGYTLNGKVLRPSQVVVGRKYLEQETEEQLEKTVDTGDYA